MSLNANQPTDQMLVSEIPSWIRAIHVAINSIVGSGTVGTTRLVLNGGPSSLSVGTDLGTFGLEAVIISATSAADIATILGGIEGQIKIFIFEDANIRFVDGAKAAGALYLNQLPVGSFYSPQFNYVIALVNIGGDGVAPGWWQELYRMDAVK